MKAFLFCVMCLVNTIAYCQAPVEEYYENGVLKSTGKYKNNKREGLWKFYEKDGNLISSGSYVNDKKNGIWNFYYHDGKLSETGNYKNNFRIGEWKSYHENGQVSEKGSYKQPKSDIYESFMYDYDLEHDEPYVKTGEWKSYYESGQVKSIGFYEENMKTGPWLFYGKKGNIKFKGSYKNNEPIGEWIAYYENGKPVLKGKYQQDIIKNELRGNQAHSKSIGVWISYWDDGSEAMHYNFDVDTGYIEKVISTKFKDKYIYPDGGYGKGQTVMSLTFSYNNVTQKLVVNFEQSLTSFGSFYRYGKWEEYTKEGWKYAEGNYNWKTNKTDGLWTFYNKNGILTATKAYKDGILDGTTTFFRENGGKSSEEVFANGKTMSITRWDKDGILEEKSIGNGINTLNRVYYYSNGNIKSFGADVWNNKEKKYQRQGNWTFNYENGTKHTVEIYKDGVAIKTWEQFLKTGEKTLSDGNGEIRVYHNNGQISFKAQMKNGGRDGISTWYYDNGQIEQSALYQYDEKLIPIGKRMEIISSFHRDGRPREKGTLKNGNGTWISYNEKGEISVIKTYKNGNVVE